MSKAKAKKAETSAVVTQPEKPGVTKAGWALKPSLNAAGVIQTYQGNILGNDVDFDSLIRGLQTSFKTAEQGDLSGLEAMLIGQATALQTIFASLARRAQSQENLRQFESFLALALKAQSQSRATIQAVVELKYPRQVAFVKQANISHGPQQINNGVTSNSGIAPSHAHAGKNQSQQSKLLEGAIDGSTHLDTRATPATSRSDPALETVGTVNRANKRRR